MFYIHSIVFLHVACATELQRLKNDQRNGTRIWAASLFFQRADLLTTGRGCTPWGGEEVYESRLCVDELRAVSECVVWVLRYSLLYGFFLSSLLSLSLIGEPTNVPPSGGNVWQGQLFWRRGMFLMADMLA